MHTILFYFISNKNQIYSQPYKRAQMRQFFVKKNFHDKLKVGISLVVGERGGHFTKHLLDAPTIMWGLKQTRQEVAAERKKLLDDNTINCLLVHTSSLRIRSTLIKLKFI